MVAGRLTERSHVCNGLLQALDPIIGECGYGLVLTGVDAQAAIFREHVDRQFVQPLLIFAEHLGDVADGEDVCDGSHD
jgi:hypothetical protein